MFIVNFLIYALMLLCSNCVVRLSPVLCKYLATSSLSTLPLKSWLPLGTSLGNSIRSTLLSSSQPNMITGTKCVHHHHHHLHHLFFFLAFSISHSRSFRTSSKRDKKDYYEVLGVPKTASAKDVKKAYYTVSFFFFC